MAGKLIRLFRGYIPDEETEHHHARKTSPCQKQIDVRTEKGRADQIVLLIIGIIRYYTVRQCVVWSVKSQLCDTHKSGWQLLLDDH